MIKVMRTCLCKDLPKKKTKDNSTPDTHIKRKISLQSITPDYGLCLTKHDRSNQTLAEVITALIFFTSPCQRSKPPAVKQMEGGCMCSSTFCHLNPKEKWGCWGLGLLFVSTNSPTEHGKIWQWMIIYQTWEVLLSTSPLLQLSGPRLHLQPSWGDPAQPTSVAHTGLETTSWDPQGQALHLNREETAATQTDLTGHEITVGSACQILFKTTTSITTGWFLG